MGINFEFATATRIIFGNNTLEKVPELISQFGGKVVLVTGKNTPAANTLSTLLHKKHIPFEIIRIASEPTTTDIELGVLHTRNSGCNVVIGLGGGSAIDAAKAIAALAANYGEITDYLEVIGKGKSLVASPLPCIAIPTTAGTGAEVTKNSVIKSTKQNVKVSLRSDLMFPRVAVIDPTLTYTMSPELTASTGVDALTHLLETFVSNQPNPLADMAGREGMQRISNSLISAFKNGNDMEARENMALAGMLGGMALANAKLGAVHGFAGPMGGMFYIPHGAVCACLLPAAMEINIAALKNQNQLARLARYDEVAQILTATKNATASDGMIWVNELIKKLKIPTLSDFGISENYFPELVEKASRASSMKGNPVELNTEQLLAILYKSL